MKTREQVIEELKSAGLWNEDAVKSMRPDFVEAALDFFRFTEEKCRIECTKNSAWIPVLPCATFSASAPRITP